MKKSKNNMIIFYSVMLGIILVLWLYIPLLKFFLLYKYPKFVTHVGFIRLTLVMLPSVALCTFLLFKHNKLKLTLEIVLDVLLAISLFFGSNVSALYGVYMEIVSETHNVNNYLSIDLVSSETYSKLTSVFPAEVPECAENPEYSYVYMRLASSELYLLASWKLPDDEYQKEKQRIISSFPEAVLKEKDGENIYTVYDWFDKKSRIFFSCRDKTNLVTYGYYFKESDDAFKFIMKDTFEKYGTRDYTEVFYREDISKYYLSHLNN